jgi:hypothetical protein
MDVRESYDLGTNRSTRHFLQLGALSTPYIVRKTTRESDKTPIFPHGRDEIKFELLAMCVRKLNKISG